MISHQGNVKIKKNCNENYNEKPLYINYRSAKIKRPTIPSLVKDVEQVEL